MDPRIALTLTDFAPITLDQLNAKAAMLERLDNKYIIPADRFRPALQDFAQHFDVLDIGAKRAFTYATRYFDDRDLQAYHDHHQGRRKRCKVRIRTYLDAGYSYLEVKLKDRRQITVKKRLRLDGALDRIDDRAMAFIETCHRELYDAYMGRALVPVIGMEYERITLVARDGGERMTIDTALKFETADRMRAVRPDMFIVETKSARGNGLADVILRGLHLHPTKSCSKYCVGLAACGLVARRNRFLPALRRLDLLEGGAAHV
jgi:hypothetical protein